MICGNPLPERLNRANRRRTAGRIQVPFNRDAEGRRPQEAVHRDCRPERPIVRPVARCGDGGLADATGRRPAGEGGGTAVADEPGQGAPLETGQPNRVVVGRARAGPSSPRPEPMETEGMSWQSISDIVFRMRQTADRLPDVPIRQKAAALATQAYGKLAVLKAPALINLAALTILMQPRVVVHRISPGAVRLVHKTDLRTLPGEPPRLLRGAWIVEAREPGREILFGATASLAGYPLDESIYLIGLDWPDGVKVSRWTPRWDELDLDAAMPERDRSPLIDDMDAHHEWAREAARFAVVLGLHLDAEGTPIATTDERKPGRQRTPRVSGPSGSAGEWVVRRIHLGRIVPSRPGRPAVESAERADERGGSGTEGRLPVTVPVRGHLRRQAYGPGRTERRWIYVEGYEARRWVAPRPLRVDVRADDDT